MYAGLLIGGEGVGGGTKGFELQLESNSWDNGDALGFVIFVCDLVRRVAAGLERGDGELAGVLLSCGESSELISMLPAEIFTCCFQLYDQPSKQSCCYSSQSIAESYVLVPVGCSSFITPKANSIE